MELFFTTILLGLGVLAWTINAIGERFASQPAPGGTERVRLPANFDQPIERRQQVLGC